MKHWNNHLPCAISYRTSGPDPEFHDITHLAICPMDTWLNVDSELPIFEMMIKPRYPEKYEYNVRQRTHAAKVLLNGADPYDFLGLFQHWFESLKMKQFHYIIPVTFDYAYLSPYLCNLFGESKNTYWHNEYRDLLPVANYLNDYADTHICQVPIPKIDLRYICFSTGTKIPPVNSFDMFQECRAIAETYKKLMRPHIAEMHHDRKILTEVDENSESSS